MPHSVRNIAFALLLFMAAGTLRAQTATTNAATGVTDLAATLNGYFDSGNITYWVYFQLGTDTNYGTTISGNPVAFIGMPAQAVTGSTTSLQPSTTYHYRLVGYKYAEAQPSVVGQDVTFTTGPAATPPSFNGTFDSFQAQQTQATALLPVMYSGAAATSVVLEYGPTAAYGSTQTIANLTPNNSYNGGYFALHGLTSGTTYHVHLVASSAVGTVTTPDTSFTTTSPEVLTTGTATNVTDISATLNGTLIQNGNYVEYIFMEVGTNDTDNWDIQTYGNGTDPQPISVTTTTLLPNTQYHFRLVIMDSELGYLYGDYHTFTTGPPASPPSISGTVFTQTTGPTEAIVSVGSVSAGGSPATVVFEYGTSTAYGSQVAIPAPLGITTSSYEQVTLTGLQPGTTYHVRCSATNGQGTTSSPDAVFTLPVAPTLVTLAAVSVSDLNANLYGTVNIPGTFTFLTIEVEWGTTTSYGNSVQAMPGYSDVTVTSDGVPTGLQPSTTYHYRIRAHDNNGVYYYGQDMTFTTLAPATLPDVGSVGTNVGTTTAQVDCYGFAGSSPATVYFDYGPTTAYGSTVTAGDPVGTNTWENTQATLTGLSMLSTYHVRCRMVNNEGTATSPDATFTTNGLPVVTTDPATGVTDLAATLHGSINANGPSTTATLSFDYGTDTNYGSTVAASPGSILSSSLTPFTGTPAGLLPGTTYHYRAKVYYAFQDLTFLGPDATFTTGVAATPPTVSAAFTNAVTDTTAAVEAFTVTAGSSPATVIWEFGTSTAYGSTVSSNPGTIATGGTSSASAVITGLTPNTTYHYRCTATNAQGGTSSADATFTTRSSPVLVTSALYTATDLTATLNGSVTYNGTPFNGFFLYFEWGTDTTYGSQTGASGFGTAQALTLTGNATGLLPNTTYHYRVKGVTSNVWYYGQDQTLTTGPPATPPSIVTGYAGVVTTTSMTLSTGSLATGSSATTVSYDYGPDTNYGTTVVYPTPLPPSQTTGSQGILTLPPFNNGPFFLVPITGLTPGTTYHYRAKAVNNEGTSFGADVSFTTPALPTVTTGAATNVGTVSATLNGTVTGQGVVYTSSFDYGPTTDYGSNVPALSPIFITLPINGGLINLAGSTVTSTSTSVATTTNGSGLTTVSTSGTGTLNLNGGFVTGGSNVINLLDWGTYSGATFNSSQPVIMSGGTTGGTPSTVIANGQPATPANIIIGNPIGGTGGIIIIGNQPTSATAALTGLTPSTTYHYRLKVTDSAGNSYFGDDMTLTTIGPDALAQNWRQEYFSSPDNSGAASDMANPSGDGIPNLLKYALGLDPTVSSASSIPQPVLKTYNGLTYLDYTFQRDSSMTDLTYAVQAADNPAGPWSTVASSVGGAVTTGPGFVTETPLLSVENVGVSLTPNTVYVVEVHDIVSTVDAPRRFMRLQVTRP